MAIVTVIGAGSWGTALALLLARNGHTTRLWGRDEASLLAMQESRENTRYLPGIPFPETLTAVTDFDAALKETSLVLLAVPSHAIKTTLIQLAERLPQQTYLVTASKGIDPDTLQLQDALCKKHCPTHAFAAISGPSFAREVATNQPTAVLLASDSSPLLADVTPLFHSETFRVYTSSDIVGVEIAGAVKNVLAIAVGIAEGLGFGANARAALVTRGLHEMTQLGLALGGSTETFSGLAGLGDLVLTCTDNQSRNRRFGLAVGQGLTAEAAAAEVGQVVEGARNAKEIRQLATEHAVEMPIVEQVYQVLYVGIKPSEAVKSLLTRTPKW